MLAIAWALTLAIAYGYAIATAAGIAIGIAALTLACLGLTQVAAVISVTESGVRAGRAVLPVAAIGAVEELDADAARRRRGTDADSRAFVLLRGWLPLAVTVVVDDVSDPTPYWYLSSRSPDRLAAAVLTIAGTRSDTAGNVTGSALPPSVEEGT